MINESHDTDDRSIRAGSRLRRKSGGAITAGTHMLSIVSLTVRTNYP